MKTMYWLATLFLMTFTGLASSTQIACLGDSLTEGFPDDNYPAVLQELLGQEFDVVNLGEGGATAIRDSDLPIWESQSWYTLMNSTPDIVIIMLGSNDMSDEVTDAQRAFFQKDYQSLVERVLALPSSPRVVLCFPPPAYEYSEEGDRRLREIAIPVIASVAGDLGLEIIDLYNNVDDYPENYPDGAHPEGEGVVTIAQLMMSALLGLDDQLLSNSGFEQGSQGWTNATMGSWEYFAPVDGTSYLASAAGSQPTVQQTNIVVLPQTDYTLTVWARSIYDDDETSCLRDCVPEQLGIPNSSRVQARVSLRAGDSIVSVERDVSPKNLSGAVETNTNDDGANVWVDQRAGYRHAFSENHFYQPQSADPIADPWMLGDLPFAFQQNDMLAKGVAVFPNGARRVYGFNSDNEFCQGTGENCQAVLFANVMGPGDPLYNIPDEPDENYVAWNAGDEDPWLGDPHVYVDEMTGRVWLTLGGGTGIYVSELDPESGYLLGFDGPVNFDQNPEAFILVADWNGDEWTHDSEWFEGAALFRHGDWWYLMTSNGSLAKNYTIRMGRGTSPTGPFFDRRGRNMSEFDPADEEFGNSFLLGDDGSQLLSGHPHIWEEEGKFYLGYDYRTTKNPADPEFDFMGIRRLYWVDGWPTIWTPIQVTFRADDHPEAVGERLQVELSNVGDALSVAGFDRLRLGSVETARPTTWLVY